MDRPIRRNSVSCRGSPPVESKTAVARVGIAPRQRETRLGEQAPTIGHAQGVQLRTEPSAAPPPAQWLSRRSGVARASLAAFLSHSDVCDDERRLTPIYVVDGERGIRRTCPTRMAGSSDPSLNSFVSAADVASKGVITRPLSR